MFKAPRLAGQTRSGQGSGWELYGVLINAGPAVLRVPRRPTQDKPNSSRSLLAPVLQSLEITVSTLRPGGQVTRGSSRTSAIQRKSGTKRQMACTWGPRA